MNYPLTEAKISLIKTAQNHEILIAGKAFIGRMLCHASQMGVHLDYLIRDMKNPGSYGENYKLKFKATK